MPLLCLNEIISERTGHGRSTFSIHHPLTLLLALTTRSKIRFPLSPQNYRSKPDSSSQLPQRFFSKSTLENTHDGHRAGCGTRCHLGDGPAFTTSCESTLTNKQAPCLTRPGKRSIHVLSRYHCEQRVHFFCPYYIYLHGKYKGSDRSLLTVTGSSACVRGLIHLVERYVDYPAGVFCGRSERRPRQLPPQRGYTSLNRCGWRIRLQLRGSR